jgi:hypothetical protein
MALLGLHLADGLLAAVEEEHGLVVSVRLLQVAVVAVVVEMEIHQLTEQQIPEAAAVELVI